MGEYGKRAEQLFMEGYNCSQAVLLSYSDITGLDDKTAAVWDVCVRYAVL